VVVAKSRHDPIDRVRSSTLPVGASKVRLVPPNSSGRLTRRSFWFMRSPFTIERDREAPLQVALIAGRFFATGTDSIMLGIMRDSCQAWRAKSCSCRGLRSQPGRGETNSLVLLLPRLP
jgi:hypothetical protein